MRQDEAIGKTVEQFRDKCPVSCTVSLRPLDQVVLSQPICCCLTNYHNWGIFTEYTLIVWHATQVRCLGVAPLAAVWG